MLTMDVGRLHCVSLGVFQDFLAEMTQNMVQVNALRVPTTSGVAQLQTLTVLRMEQRLFDSYKSENDGGRVRTRVQRLEPTMFGTADKPTCKLHGSETHDFLDFAITMVLL